MSVTILLRMTELNKAVAADQAQLATSVAEPPLAVAVAVLCNNVKHYRSQCVDGGSNTVRDFLHFFAHT